jgi:hypothetical protein
MFQKKQKIVEQPKVVPKTPEIEEMEEYNDEVVESPKQSRDVPSKEVPVEDEEEGLTEEMVSSALLNHQERLRRIEHHLRIDF